MGGRGKTSKGRRELNSLPAEEEARFSRGGKKRLD